MDDAGGGNIIGGLVIGALKGKSYTSRVIGPEWFALGSGVKPIVSATVLEIVHANGSPKNVVLCRSDIFDQSARDLGRLGFSVSRAIINGSLQDRTEEDFFRHLIDLGLPDYVMSMFPGENTDKSRCYRSLNEYCVRFLMADFKSRRHTAKENCRTFKTLCETHVTRTFVSRIRDRRSRRCVECGDTVRDDAWLYRGGPTSFYIHKSCAPAAHATASKEHHMPTYKGQPHGRQAGARLN